MNRASAFLSPPPRLAPNRRWWPTRAARLVALPAALIPWLPLFFFAPPAQALGFGDIFVHAACLRISAESYQNRQGEFDNQDWVTMLVTNRCKFPVKHLEVAFALIDNNGVVYGRRLWLLGAGIYLPPGKSRRERYSIPDPDNRTAVAWDVEVLQVFRTFPGGRR